MGSTRRPGERSILAAILGAGLAIRLLLTPYGAFRGDAQTFRAWAERLVNTPLRDFYAAGGRQVDHLPGDLWFLWAIAHIYRLLSPAFDLQALGFLFLLKLVPSLADIGIAALLYLIARRLAGGRAGLLAAALIAFNPASIFLSATWGQWDSVSALFMVLGLWLLLGGRPAAALPALSYAALIKPQLALLLPLALLAWWRWSLSPPGRPSAPGSRWRPLTALALGVLASLALFLLVDLPFNVGLPLLPTRWTIFERLAVALGAYQTTSENAFNLWILLAHGTSSRAIPDSQPFLAGISYQHWGWILLAIVFAGVLALCWRRSSPSMLLWGSLALTFALFMLPTRMHERYLFPAMVLAVLLSAVAPGLRWLSVALSTTYAINLYAVYHGFAQSSFGRASQLSNAVALSDATANLFLLLVVVAVGLLLARQISPVTERAIAELSDERATVMPDPPAVAPAAISQRSSQ